MGAKKAAPIYIFLFCNAPKHPPGVVIAVIEPRSDGGNTFEDRSTRSGDAAAESRYFIGCAEKNVNISSLATISIVSFPASPLADSPPGHW